MFPDIAMEQACCQTSPPNPGRVDPSEERPVVDTSSDPISSRGKINIIQGKGDFLGGGTTGLVERLKSGDVIKSPWTGRPTASDCRKEMAIEAQIYKKLGAHPRLVAMKHWDPVEHTLVLEYMPHGNIKDYVQRHRTAISLAQKQQWVMEAAEGVELLHSHRIIQGDVGPHNFLLDVDLGLRICDFAGSSLDGSRAMVAPGVRYRLPSLVTERAQPATVKEDLFALGSTIYFIATGHEPYHELANEDEVEQLYADGVFPELDNVPFGEIIALCWRQKPSRPRWLLNLLGAHRPQQQIQVKQCCLMQRTYRRLPCYLYRTLSLFKLSHRSNTVTACFTIHQEAAFCHGA